ncbi:MAG: family 20 glycosylhydrolase [Clostridium sp.]
MGSIYKVKGKKLNSKILIGLIIIALVVIVVFVVKGKSGAEPVSIRDGGIIPKPLSYEVSDGDFQLSKSTSIYVKGNSDEESDEIYIIAELIKSEFMLSTGFDFNIIKSNNVPDDSIYLTTVGGEESQGNEGYKIDTKTNGVKIVAYKPEGISRGVQTLRQLLPSDIEKSTVVNDINWVIPVSTITDKPEYGYRGLMLDVARHFFSVDEVKRQIDLASRYKINKFHMHLSDDQGWRLEIKKWPDLALIGGSTQIGGGNGGYYTQEEFKDIVKYASDRYVEIIPEFDMPGHTNAALASYGFLNKDGKKKQLYTGSEVGFSSLMCRDEKTYLLIEDIIKEVSEISPSKYIHIGGDEPKSTEKADYDYFIGRVTKIVEKYGKIAIGWDPSDTSNQSSPNSILQNWKDSNAAAKDKNMKMIISLAGKTYLDMKYDNNTKYGLTWAGYNSIEDSYNWDPTDYAPKELVLGIEAPLWTETISDRAAMDYMIYPRLLGYAEIGWTPKESRTFDDYKGRLAAQGERLENQGVNYYGDKQIWKNKK